MFHPIHLPLFLFLLTHACALALGYRLARRP
jgi:hypothetical protein